MVVRAKHRGEHLLASIVALLVFDRGADHAEGDADWTTIERIAGDLCRVARPLAGQPAIDRADDRQMLQRIDDIEDVAEPEAARIVPCRPRVRGRISLISMSCVVIFYAVLGGLLGKNEDSKESAYKYLGVYISRRALHGAESIEALLVQCPGARL